MSDKVWDYRVGRSKEYHPSDDNSIAGHEEWLSIQEIYYGDDEKPAAQTIDIKTKEIDFELPSVDKRFYSVYATYEDGNAAVIGGGLDGADPSDIFLDDTNANALNATSIIEQYIQPYLEESEVQNFYYQKYKDDDGFLYLKYTQELMVLIQIIITQLFVILRDHRTLTQVQIFLNLD